MITVHAVKDAGVVNITISGASINAFKALIQRGSNLWPDAPPEIKELADTITNDGIVMQDYWAQVNQVKPTNFGV